MRLILYYSPLLVFLLISFSAGAQIKRKGKKNKTAKTDLAVSYKYQTVVDLVKDFGAKPNDNLSDHEAFLAASQYINTHQKEITLVIPKGVYLVGKQITSTKNKTIRNKGQGLFELENCHSIQIAGQKGAIIKYQNGFQFGSFNPETNKPHINKGRFYDVQYAHTIGEVFSIRNCNNLSIENLELDGNNAGMHLGGVFGDKGIQLTHDGIYIVNSQNISLSNINAHHFCRDGIMISNKVSNTTEQQNDNIQISNCKFEYNFRQGLSWIGGNGLFASNTSFSFTGRSVMASAPAAGLDIEAETGMIRNGRFDHCSFIDNSGCGLVADNGDSRNVQFNDCIFWGTEAWSNWTVKPGYVYRNCTFHGSIVYGFSADNDEDATKYIHCVFEDKPYKGKKAFGNFLVEVNQRKRLLFDSCTFTANYRKAVWIDGSGTWKDNEYTFVQNCIFNMNHLDFREKDYISILRAIKIKNCVFNIKEKKENIKGKYIQFSGSKLLGNNPINYLR